MVCLASQYVIIALHHHTTTQSVCTDQHVYQQSVRNHHELALRLYGCSVDARARPANIADRLA